MARQRANFMSRWRELSSSGKLSRLTSSFPKIPAGQSCLYPTSAASNSLSPRLSRYPVGGSQTNPPRESGGHLRRLLRGRLPPTLITSFSCLVCQPAGKSELRAGLRQAIVAESDSALSPEARALLAFTCNLHQFKSSKRQGSVCPCG